MLPTDANSQAKTVTVEIELPTLILESIRARVASGEFASESEAVTHLLGKAEQMYSIESTLHDTDDEWDNEIRETIARLDRGEEPTYTLEEVRQHLGQRREQRAAA